jgi:hypothetical protein
LRPDRGVAYSVVGFEEWLLKEGPIMSQQVRSDRVNVSPAGKSTWLSRFGLWTGLVLLAAVAIGVFALVACKASRW